ncbi:hypothetical protein GGR26_001565 [Lewinella marina]|uniref:Secretion system C-terminal sorting domain-containing protein n=1 Tax=Neolewinella marina TaxID=438751 RepID=A0A2G0CEV5_9BACT|nr:T9SS type A sorting domain-containing protein [Neolewinella marina]NJB85820.1 hypothetical protein [Neolewinella marina]PHK98511.1 hypothetical protein CGL56_08515 [Neolewinella marina]
MKTLLSFLLCVSIGTGLPAQMISHFTWNNTADGPLKADFGPNAVSADSDVYISANGAGGTSGLNPGTTTPSVNLVLADSPIFDVNGIDISFDFQRNESMGTLFQRGFFILGSATSVSVVYRTDNGAGGFREVSSGAVASFTDDDTRNDDFENIRFVYTPSTGLGELYHKGVQVWSDPTPVPGRNLYWTGAGNIVMGTDIDASLANLAVFDNFLIQEVEGASLPVSFTDFRAEAFPKQGLARLHWETHRESNNARFEVERSVGHQGQWTVIGSVAGAGNSTSPRQYEYLDEQPTAGSAYYRLRQVDADGSASYSDVVVLHFTSPETPEAPRAFPNPATHRVSVVDAAATQLPAVVNARGQRIPVVGQLGPGGYELDISDWTSGIYYLHSASGRVTVIKR